MNRKVIRREKYIQQIKPFIGKDIIKVITGQRRVGKSYFLLMVSEEIRKKYPDANFIFINKELHEFENIRTYTDLLQFVKSKSKKDTTNFLFIDEVQEIENFEKALRELILRENFDVYVTGSNSRILSGDLATLLSGRYIEIKIFSLTYPEFLKFHNIDPGRESLNLYLKYGGMPYLKNLELSDEVVFDYLKSIYNSIILRDVVERRNIRNVHFLNTLVNYVGDNIGNPLSAKKISDFLNSQRIKMSVVSIMNYLKFLEDAYFIHRVKRLDLHGKKIFEINDKFYFEDVGIRNALLGFGIENIGGIIENIVFKHLLSEGYRVFVGKIGDREIDFVAEKGGERVYIQVCYMLSDERVWKREFGNLLQIKDNYRKVVVSLDPIQFDSYKGIQHRRLEEFLMEF